ncbi:MAG: phosphoenolpyruvate-protein phosphotransferase [Paenibacillus sp.]|nr:phosphoenolpyruvate-protein phosphotransferase [Paenibacillus sp.]
MAKTMNKRLSGIAASPGIAIAKAFRLNNAQYEPAPDKVADVQIETARFRQAVEEARQELEQIRAMTEERMGAEKAEIFEAHLLLLEDPDLIDPIIENIEREGINAQYALHEVANSFIEVLSSMDNELLRERAAISIMCLAL